MCRPRPRELAFPMLISCTATAKEWSAAREIWTNVCGSLRSAPPGCQRLILFLAADVSDIVVLLIAILDQDRAVEVLIVIIVHLG